MLSQDRLGFAVSRRDLPHAAPHRRSPRLVATFALAFVAAVLVASPASAATGPVLALGFDDGSGSVARDSSGSGNDGTLREAAWTTAGKYGGARSFDGVNDRGTVAGSNSRDLTRTVTPGSRVQPRANPTGRNLPLK